MQEKKLWALFIILILTVVGLIAVLADQASEGESVCENIGQIYAGDTSSGLVAHWAFDEVNGSIVHDASGNGFHGTKYGGTWTPGPIGGALVFDGNDDYVEITQNTSDLHSQLATLGAGSISLWFRVNFIPTDHGIAPIFYYGARDPCTNFFDAANQGLIIEVGHSPIHRASKRLYFTIWANGCTYPSFCFDSRHPLTEGEWYHFVAVVGEDYNTGYLNGQEMADRRYNFGTFLYSQFFADAVKHEVLWIGRGYWDAQDDPRPLYADGAIDDVRIYNRPLSSEDVEELYCEGNESGSGPPAAPSITGPSSGNIGQEYSYSFETVDPNGDDVYYSVEWGEACPGVEWMGPYPSGEPVTFSNTWQETGTYIIRAQAMDTTDQKSSWGILQVSMPKSFPAFIDG